MATGIIYPRQLPCWLLNSHEGQDEDIYATTQVDFGSARFRRLYVSTPHIRKAAMFLHGAAMDIFHSFYENDLQAGARRFLAPFRALSGEDKYYECEFVEPYNAEFVAMENAGRGWRIAASFRLYGDGFDGVPYLEPAALSGAISARLQARGAITPHAALSGAIFARLRARAGAVALAPAAPLALRLRAQYAERGDFGGAIVVALSGGA